MNRGVNNVRDRKQLLAKNYFEIRTFYQLNKIFFSLVYYNLPGEILTLLLLIREHMEMNLAVESPRLPDLI